MKPLYINVVLGAVALIGIGFGLYEYRQAHPGVMSVAQQEGQPTAPAAVFTKSSDGNWQLRCQKAAPDRCAALVNVANKNGQLVMVWAVGAARGGGLVMTIQAPTGVALEPGLDFALDSNPAHHMPFGACGPRACLARMVLDNAVQEEMRKATKATVSFALANGRKVSYTVPVQGTDKMLADMAPVAAAAPAPAAH